MATKEQQARWNANRRARYAARKVAALQHPEIEGALACPECGGVRRSLESLRVHRWLAHDVREKPKPFN